MLLQQQIADVIDAQARTFLARDAGWTRELLPELKVRSNFALIISGVRRCGKSTLLLQLLREKFTSAFYLHFEDARLAGFEKEDFARLSNEIADRKPQVLFFDEIQLLERWEQFVRQKLDEGYRVVLTGSNATLLSRELGSKLTGRHLTVELFPFSFTEFIGFRGRKNDEQAASAYLRQGGFPEYLKTGDGSVLTQLLQDILYRDIAIRYAIRDVRSLKQLAVYLISNIGKPVSANQLTNLFQLRAASTVLNYFSYLENAYIVQFLPMFSHSLQQQIRNQRKVYCTDLGMFTEASIVFSDESGRRLENAVYLHLRRKYRELYYFHDRKECDFVAMDKGEAREIIQACYVLTPDNLDREISGLLAALNHFKKLAGVIVTMNQRDAFTQNGCRIHVVPLHQFLSNEA
jgi:predicted AAA+ superfamily ATPase